MSRFLKYKYAWIAWALLFAVIEISAILDDDEDEGDYTLSHYLRRAVGTFKTSGKMTKANWAARGAIIALLAWLVPHLRLLIELF